MLDMPCKAGCHATPRDLCWQAVIQEDVRTIDLRPAKDADHEFPSSLTHFPSFLGEIVTDPFLSWKAIEMEEYDKHL